MITATFKNGLRPVADLAADKPHGHRVRYMAGCRCIPCRAANSRYETERAAARRRGEWNGIIDASEVRDHLLLLSEKGIGRDTVADITGVASSTIDLIRQGKRTGIRAMNARAILDIDPDEALNDAQLISARPTWRKIRWLLNEGFTKGELALRLGYKTPALQLNKRRITTRNAQKVEQLYNIIRTGDDE